MARASSALHIDILLVVATFCDRPTLSVLMKTCKALYQTAARYSLDEGAALYSDEEAELFLRFMRPDDGKRWRFLRRLKIRTKLLSRRSLAKEFSVAVRDAVNVEILKITEAEETLGSHPKLGWALASLPNVKHVVISDLEELACSMLEQMQWPLETAILQISTERLPGWTGEDRNRRMNLAQLLKNARHSLRSLRIEAWSGYCYYPLEPVVYPQMKSLTAAQVDSPRTAPWAIAYPNLAHLEIDTYEEDSIALDDDSLEEYADTRELNQLEHATRGTWQELESFKGGPLGLYVVGAPCRIRRVELGLSRRALYFLAASLADARPTELLLHVSESSRAPLDGSHEWLSDPRLHHALRDLRSLSLRLRSSLPSTGDFPDFMDRLTGALSHLHLVFLEVHVELDKRCRHVCDGCPSCNSDSDPDNPGGPRRPGRIMRKFLQQCPTECYFAGMNVGELAGQFLRASESLESVQVDVQISRSPRLGHDWEDKHVRMTRSDLCRSTPAVACAT